jgi:hypothetical protein
MRSDSRSLTIVLTMLVVANLAIGQTQPSKKKATNSPKQQKRRPRDRGNPTLNCSLSRSVWSTTTLAITTRPPEARLYRRRPTIMLGYLCEQRLMQ